MLVREGEVARRPWASKWRSALADPGEVGLARGSGEGLPGLCRGAQVLKIAETGGAGEHVHQAEMARSGGGLQITVQAAGEGGEILDGEGKGGAGHHILMGPRARAGHRIDGRAGESWCGL